MAQQTMAPRDMEEAYEREKKRSEQLEYEVVSLTGKIQEMAGVSSLRVSYIY